MDNEKMRKNKESLELERINFENYRREELARLEKKELDLNIKLEKINKLVKLFDEKLSGVVVDDINNYY